MSINLMTVKMKHIFKLIFTLSVLMTESCYYNNEDILYPDTAVNTPCNTTSAASYNNDIQPLLNASCNSSGCHNTASAVASVILDNYNGVKNQALNGRLIGSVKQASGYSAMPRGAGKLNACTISKLQSWVNAGAPNN